jgi:hypothetical protein
MPSIHLVMRRVGNPSFAELLPRLRCEECRRRLAPVYLVAGYHRTFHGGPAAEWSVELVPPPAL